MYLTLRNELARGQEITPVGVGAVERESVELPGFIPPTDHAFAPAPTRVEAPSDNVTYADGPLALHTHELRPQVQD